MNNLLQALLVNEEAIVGHRINQPLSEKVYGTRNGEEAINDAELKGMSGNERTLIKTLVSLLAAPFIALGYVIALPFVGLYQFAKLALEAHAKRHPAAHGKLKKVAVRVRNIGLFFASPFIALVYVIALPIVGMLMISRLAIEANAKRRYVNS